MVANLGLSDHSPRLGKCLRRHDDLDYVIDFFESCGHEGAEAPRSDRDMEVRLYREHRTDAQWVRPTGCRVASVERKEEHGRWRDGHRREGSLKVGVTASRLQANWLSRACMKVDVTTRPKCARRDSTLVDWWVSTMNQNLNLFRWDSKSFRQLLEEFG